MEVLSHPFRSTVEVKREILAIFHILLEALQPHLSQLKYYVSRQITVYSEARSSVLRYRIKFEVDCNVDIIYIRSSVDSDCNFDFIIRLNKPSGLLSKR